MGTKKEIWQRIDRRTGFTEPTGDYFEQFTSRIMEQLPEMETTEGQTRYALVSPATLGIHGGHVCGDSLDGTCFFSGRIVRGRNRSRRAAQQ